jgi:hypothetical protein
MEVTNWANAAVGAIAIADRTIALRITHVFIRISLKPPSSQPIQQALAETVAID